MIGPKFEFYLFDQVRFENAPHRASFQIDAAILMAGLDSIQNKKVWNTARAGPGPRVLGEFLITALEITPACDKITTA